MERSLCILLFLCSFSVFSNTILYSYDTLGRVEYAQKENSSNKHYLLYDNAGNRVSSQNSPETPPSNSISITSLSPENLSTFNDSQINFSWQLIGDDTDIVSYELFLSSDIEPKSYISGLTKAQISIEGVIPEFDLYWKVHAIDKYGRVYSSEIQLIKPLDTDSDGLSDYIENNRMCTNPNNVDSDNDGLSDYEEHYNLGTNPCNNDTDNDGMVDAWELLNTLDPLVNDGDIDSDGDGISNVEEYITGTDPQDATSVPFKRALIDFEDQTFGEYYWHADGHAFWLVDSHSNTGHFGAGSGLIERNQYSVMETTINAVNGMVRFDAGIFGTYSKLRFYIDGVEQLNITGEQAYATYTYPVSAGQKTLRWEYYRSDSTDTRQVRAWLDNILLPGVVDSDGDGIADGWEYRYFNQLDHVMVGDTDNDGLTDIQESITQTNPNNNDTDGDGMSDAWEIMNNLDPLINDSNLDSDGDGITNLEEYYTGSDPQDATSIPASRALIDFEDQTFGEYYWHADGEVSWLVNNCANTGNYGACTELNIGYQLSVIETTINAVDGIVHFDTGMISGGTSQLRFYINGVEQLLLVNNHPYATYSYPVSAGQVTLRWTHSLYNPEDTGQSGAWLDNIILPGLADSDGDGIADGWEYLYFNQLDHVMTGDADNDGLTDAQEEKAGTLPNNSDSDSDGMLDGWEVLNNLDPLVNDADLDSDDDGISNVEEFYSGSDPQDSTSVPTIRTKIDFENQTFGEFYWHSDGHTLWLADSHASTGNFGARSGLITQSQYSVIETTINAVDGMVRFDAGISSGYSDRLRFYIDGIEQLSLNDEQAYATYAYPIYRGQVTLRWEYYKDSSIDIGQDRAWLDNIILPGVTDSDSDDIADGWEYFYFGQLDHALAGDSDNDGLTDAQESQLHSNPNSTDSDNDGMPDLWENLHLLELNVDDSAEDNDLDGFSNLKEYHGGSDPQSSISVPDLNDSDGDGLTDIFEGIVGTDPMIVDSDFDGMPDGWEVNNQLNPLVDDAVLDADLDGYSNLIEYEASSDPQNILSIPDTGTDTDGDGLSDAQEAILGTNPHLADSDFDRIPDGWEVNNNLNPLLFDSHLDADNDGVSNMFEHMFNTDPNDPLSFPLDSDNDGLFDAWEEGLGTDINNPDSDSDTMPDGWEVFNDLNPLIDDSQQDPDGDGFTNIEEYQADTDPQDEYSLPEGEPSTGGGTNNDDTDGDGMPDSWEQENGLDSSTNDAELDKDNDGFNNLEEYLANSDCQDPLSVPFGTNVSVGNTSLTPFYWFNEGDALWQTDNVESSPGYQMLRSGVILDNQSTTVRTIVNSQGGLLRFNLSIDSEECYDFLTLLINDQEYGQWCGYGNHNIRIQLPLGKQELKWIYSKDGSYAESEDASWINNLFIPALPDSDNDGIEDALEYEEFGHLNGN